MNRIIIGSDHAAFTAKEELKSYLAQHGLEICDVGCYSEESVHYPQYAQAVAEKISSGEFVRGILLCGTGIGMSLAANRYRGVRATLVHDAFTAQACREHNDSNVLVMGARVLSVEQMKELVDIWLNTPFAGGRHAERLAMLDK